MSGEIYEADVAIYKDMIVAVGDVSDYIGPETLKLMQQANILLRVLLTDIFTANVASLVLQVLPRRLFHAELQVLYLALMNIFLFQDLRD